MNRISKARLLGTTSIVAFEANIKQIAHTDPITGMIVGALGFGAGSFAAAVVGFLVNTAFSLAFSALSMALQKRKMGDNGGLTTEQTTTGEAVPQKIILGRYATAGGAVSPSYSWGDANKNLVYIISWADAPIDGIEGFIVDGKLYQPSGTSLEQGQPLNNGLEEHAWVTSYLGNQTAASGYLVSKFGSDPERPWTENFILKGRAYSVLTFAHEPKKFAGFPEVKAVLRGMKLYDPRKDSSIGGSGTQRWATPSTWAWSDNPIVMVYNILRGITLPDGSIYGIGASASALPLDRWFAAMNVCDEAGTEPSETDPYKDLKRYRAGIEISVDQAPLDAIAELLKTCNGKISDHGGLFNVQAGGPTAAVAHITDANILISHSREESPYKGLAESYNSVSAQYPDPENLWQETSAVPLENPAWELEDQGRKLPTEIKLGSVPYAAQVRRLMREAIADHRRQRIHTLTLTPAYAGLVPLDIISWTDPAKGYSVKLFEVQHVVIDTQTLNVTVNLKEVDPSDYDLDAVKDNVKPYYPSRNVSTPSIIGVQGFSASATSITDSNGNNRRPAIRIQWDNAAAISGVAYEINNDEGHLVSNGSTTDVGKGELLVSDGILSNEPYRVFVKSIIEGYETEWSAYVLVTTGNILLGYEDFDPDLEAEIQEAKLAKQAAEASANAASLSAANASYLVGLANTAKTAAEAARNAANTAKNQANAAAIASEAQRVLAEAAALSANNTLANVVSFADLTEGYKATAQTFALAANTARTAAQTAMANAQVFANNAANSASAALGHANTARAYSNTAGNHAVAANASYMGAVAAASNSEAYALASANSATAAAASANSSAQSASFANTSAAQASANSASAKVSRDEALSAANNAAQSAAQANSSYQVTLAARNTAQTAAAASLTSANAAAVSANSSAQSALASANSALQANTARGAAVIARDEAVSAANTANTNAVLASQSAGLSVTAKDAALGAARQMLPSDFVSNEFWTSTFSTHGGSPVPQASIVSDPDFGSAYEATWNSNGNSIMPIESFQPIEGRKYRVTAKFKIMSASGVAQIGIHSRTYAEDGSQVNGAVVTAHNVVANTNPTGVITASKVFSSLAGYGVDQVVASYATAPKLRLGLRHNTASVNTVIRVGYIKIEDVTGMLASEESALSANTSATAAANSATVASAAANSAGSFAGIAQTHMLTANTRSGQAAAFALQAANSATQANASFQSASSAAGVATTARDEANRAAVDLLPSDFSQDWKNWASTWSGTPSNKNRTFTQWAIETVDGVKTAVATSPVTSNENLCPQGNIPAALGRRYRIVVQARHVGAITGNSSQAIRCYFYRLNSTYGSAGSVASGFLTFTAANTWETLEYTTPAYTHPETLMNGFIQIQSANLAAAGIRIEVRSIKVLDVTELYQAEQAASAAVIAASNAESFANSSQQWANTSYAHMLTANTRSGQAAAFSVSAANSATLANTHRSEASLSAGIATTAANNASNSAAAAVIAASNAQSFANASASHASAAQTHMLTANTRSGQAAAFSIAAANSASIANTHRIAASNSATLAANSASHAANSLNQVTAIQGVVASTANSVEQALAATSPILNVRPIAAAKAYGAGGGRVTTNIHGSWR